MKILRVAGMHYVSAKTIPYLSNPNLHKLPYAEQLKTLFSYHFHYGDSLTHYLKDLGYECHETLYDLEPLQKKWAEEAGYIYSEDSWQNEILIQQIRAIKPDILFLQNLQTPPYSLMKQRKALFPYLKCLIIFRGYPETNQTLLKYLSLADILLVGSPILETICKKQGLAPRLFHHYFDERVLGRLQENPQHECTFFGTSGLGFDWVHQPRYYYLHELLKEDLIECWLEESSGYLNSWKAPIKRTLERAFSLAPDRLLEKLQASHRFPSAVHKLAFNSLARKSSLRNGYPLFPIQKLHRLYPNQCHHPFFGLEMYQGLKDSRITFNKHSFAALNTVDNIRLFQATGVGSCLLTDWGTNLSELFEIDQEVVTYTSLDECKEKIRFLRDNEKVRAAIGKRGQQRTLKDHTAKTRADQLNTMIKNRLNEKIKRAMLPSA